MPAPDTEAGLQQLKQGSWILSILPHQWSTQSLASIPSGRNDPLPRTPVQLAMA